MNRVLIVKFDDDVPMSDVLDLEKSIYHWLDLQRGIVDHPVDLAVEYKEVDFESEFTFEEGEEDAKNIE